MTREIVQALISLVLHRSPRQSSSWIQVASLRDTNIRVLTRNRQGAVESHPAPTTETLRVKTRERGIHGGK